MRHIEPKRVKTAKTDPAAAIGTPDLMLLQCEDLAVIDDLSGPAHPAAADRRPTPDARRSVEKTLAVSKVQISKVQRM